MLEVLQFIIVLNVVGILIMTTLLYMLNGRLEYKDMKEFKTFIYSMLLIFGGWLCIPLVINMVCLWVSGR